MKKAVSTIIATAILILIIITSISILWYFIKPSVTQSNSFETIPDIMIDTESGYTYWDENEQVLCIQIERGPEEKEIKNIEITVTINGNSEKQYFSKENIPEPNQRSSECFNSKKPDSIKMVPIYESSDSSSGFSSGNSQTTISPEEENIKEGDFKGAKETLSSFPSANIETEVIYQEEGTERYDGETLKENNKGSEGGESSEKPTEKTEEETVEEESSIIICTDEDEDGYNQSKKGCGIPDCDDTDSDIFPGNAEICDGKDNDCDGVGTDLNCAGICDTDGDGYNSPFCFWLPNNDDCDDNIASVYPNAPEKCDGIDNQCYDGEIGKGQIDEDCFSYPYYEEEKIFQFSDFQEYIYDGKTYYVSPIIDAGYKNELIHHKLTIDFNSNTGDVKASIGHFWKNDLEEVFNKYYRHTSFVSMTPEVEKRYATQYRRERYAWVILEISENPDITKINLTHWVGFDTVYGHLPFTFEFEDSYIPYRILYPKNYQSDNGKKYPLVVSVPGSGEVGTDNVKQMGMIVYGRYAFERYYHDEEFESFSIVPQMPVTGVQNSETGTIPEPYYPNKDENGNYGPGRTEHPLHPDWAVPNENGYYAKAIDSLIRKLIANKSLNIDENRIYFTGFSYGGKTAFETAKQSPDIWAAILPASGWPIGGAYRDYTNPTKYPDNNIIIKALKQEVQRYKHIPFLITAGENEGMKYGAELACRELNSAGGDCQYYIHTRANHVANAGRTYANRNYIEWMFNQKKYVSKICQEEDTMICGTNTGICTEGIQKCVKGYWTKCDANWSVYSSESYESIKNDGLDNDCDGEIDENYDPALEEYNELYELCQLDLECLEENKDKYPLGYAKYQEYYGI